jgi:hypothetical protein
VRTRGQDICEPRGARRARTRLGWVVSGVFYSFVLAVLLVPAVFLFNLVSYLIGNATQQSWPEEDYPPEQWYRLMSAYSLLLPAGLIVVWIVCYLRRRSDD